MGIPGAQRRVVGAMGFSTILRLTYFCLFSSSFFWPATSSPANSYLQIPVGFAGLSKLYLELLRFQSGSSRMNQRTFAVEADCSLDDGFAVLAAGARLALGPKRALPLGQLKKGS